MFQEIGSAFMITFKRDIGGSCLKKNSTPTRIRQVSPDPWVKLNDEGIMLNKAVKQRKAIHLHYIGPRPFYVKSVLGHFLFFALNPCI